MKKLLLFRKKTKKIIYKTFKLCKTLFKSCGEDGIRTHDLLTASQAL